MHVWNAASQYIQSEITILVRYSHLFFLLFDLTVIDIGCVRICVHNIEISGSMYYRFPDTGIVSQAQWLEALEGEGVCVCVCANAHWCIMSTYRLFLT